MSNYTIVPNDNIYFHYDTDIVILVILCDEDLDVLCSEDELCKDLSATTNCNSVNWGFSMGRSYIKIHKNDLKFAQVIIQTILDKGFRVFLNDCSELTIRKSDLEGGVYNQTTREKLLLQKNIESKTRYAKYWDVNKSLKSYEWKLAGRVKLPELKHFLLEHFPDENREDNFYKNINWDECVCVSANLTMEERDNTVNTLNINEVKQHDDDNTSPNDNDDDDNVCIMCYDAERETYLEPCGHIVICEACSDKLRNEENNSNLKNNCIYCRQHIDSISYLKTSKMLRFDK